MDHAAVLRKRLSQNEIVLAPGIYDALTASLVEKAGFEAALKNWREVPDESENQLKA